jgi:hypothetical protein
MLQIQRLAVAIAAAAAPSMQPCWYTGTRHVPPYLQSLRRLLPQATAALNTTGGSSELLCEPAPLVFGRAPPTAAPTSASISSGSTGTASLSTCSQHTQRMLSIEEIAVLLLQAVGNVREYLVPQLTVHYHKHVAAVSTCSAKLSSSLTCLLSSTTKPSPSLSRASTSQHDTSN